MGGLSTMTNSLCGVLDYEQSLSSSENARVYEFSWRQRTRKRARKSPATREFDAEGDVPEWKVTFVSRLSLSYP